jgi:uncharacterized OB-fold protein
MTDRPFTAASFNQYLKEKKLMGSRCPHCDQVFLPPRAICPVCHGSDLVWSEVSSEGTLAAFTSIYVGPTFMNDEGYSRDKPYCTGIVELEGGVRISARILDVDASDASSIAIGTRLKVAFLERGQGEETVTYLAFKPV